MMPDKFLFRKNDMFYAVKDNGKNPGLQNLILVTNKCSWPQ